MGNFLSNTESAAVRELLIPSILVSVTNAWVPSKYPWFQIPSFCIAVYGGGGVAFLCCLGSFARAEFNTGVVQVLQSQTFFVTDYSSPTFAFANLIVLKLGYTTLPVRTPHPLTLHLRCMYLSRKPQQSFGPYHAYTNPGSSAFFHLFAFSRLPSSTAWKRSITDSIR